jgi:Domain of unknown function (DUF4375)
MINRGCTALLMRDAAEDIEIAYQAVGRDLFNSDDLRRDLARRDPDEAAFFTLVLIGSEIDNGGFSQLFTNSTGDLIGEAIAGAEGFGLKEHARLLQDASEELFRGGVPLDHETRLQQWEHLDDAADSVIEALDARWYALDATLEQRLATYARGRAQS